MTETKDLIVKESASDLKKLYTHSAYHLRPRIKMLQYVLRAVHSNNELSTRIGVNRNTIADWKKRYASSGLQGLLADKRGGDYRSGIDDTDKKKIAEKLSTPKNAFTSYGEAQQWMKEELGIDKGYHAVNKYLKRNFGVKLKVGRKSHVKKDEAAIAVFKKPL